MRAAVRCRRTERRAAPALLAWTARRFGTSLVLPMMLAEEGREVQAYLGLARHSRHRQYPRGRARNRDRLGGSRARACPRRWAGTASRGTSAVPAAICAASCTGSTTGSRQISGWSPESSAPTSRRTSSIISGVAGAIADALSMGSSGYLAAKSESEVHAHQIEIERQEMKLMPDLEEEELAVIYEAKGLTPERARETARAIMQEPHKALDTMVREELNIHPAELAPLRDGLVTGTATAIGAFIPIVPFFVLDHWPAVWASLVLSMAAHFAIGAARSLFTGRGVWSSGRDMFVVGFGVAAIGYFIGELVTQMM